MLSIITMDGPSGAGKGLLSRSLGRYLHFSVLDTGLMYRAFALQIFKNNIDPKDIKSVTSCLSSFSLASMEVSESLLRQESIAQLASILSTYPQVRSHLTSEQRHFASHPPSPFKGVILDGRDAGTVIFPEAPLKFYITADLKIRAHRRWKELHQKGHVCMVDDVQKDLEDRDRRDRERAIAPLEKAPDAILIDTSSLTPEDMLQEALVYVKESGILSR